jgi:hypothetical protein
VSAFVIKTSNLRFALVFTKCFVGAYYGITALYAKEMTFHDNRLTDLEDGRLFSTVCLILQHTNSTIHQKVGTEARPCQNTKTHDIAAI